MTTAQPWFVGLEVLVLLASGLVAGVMFAIALSTVPALAELPPPHYVVVHTLLGRNWDPTMPVIVLSATGADAGLAWSSHGFFRILFLVAAASLLLVSIISHWRNVPINRAVHHTDPDAISGDWTDPRPRWRQWHLRRTTCAAIALLANAVAIACIR
jgi:uncharacterized membrane protein